jgi:hypothetical protein
VFDVWDFGMPVMDEWQHISLVFDPGEPVQAFIDGLSVGSGNINLSPTVSDRPMLMGQPVNLANTDDYLNAHLDEVLFWSTALTQEEIQSYIYNPPAGSEEGMLGYWKFDAGNGDLLYDHSGNQNHANIIGAAWDDGVLGPATSFSITGTSGFRMLSSPVSGTIYADLLEELWTQGMVGSNDPYHLLLYRYHCPGP